MRKTHKASMILSDIRTPNQALRRINNLTYSQLHSQTDYSDAEMIECINDISAYSLYITKTNK